jgi:hypothetical protein
MPSEEFCRDLLQKANDALDSAIDALDGLFDAVDEMEDNAKDSMQSWVKTSVHVAGGDFGDAVGDILDASNSRGKFERSAGKVDRALGKFDNADGKFRDAMRAWCDQCGDPPDSVDTSSAQEISFGESEVDPIVAYPR